MSMVDVRSAVKSALGDGYSVIQATMNYVDGGVRQLFRFTILTPDGISAVIEGAVAASEEPTDGAARLASEWKQSNGA